MEITVHIDCATCPGRPRACDGCMMSVFVGMPEARSSGDGLRSVGSRRDIEVDDLRAAVDTFIAVGLTGPSARRSPIVVETRGQQFDTLAEVRQLRAG